MKVFLGGTCNESKWREILKPLLLIDYFDPVVPEWSDAARKRELHERQMCDYVLYTITPRMLGVYSIAEVVDDSNKRPKQTLLCLLESDEEAVWTEGQWKSLCAVYNLVYRNGATVCYTLEMVANSLNRWAGKA